MMHAVPKDHLRVPDTSTATKTKTDLKIPSQWRIMMHNDDFTPFDFVIEILQVVFNKSAAEGDRLAAIIHEHGIAQIGLYTKEVALTKVKQVKTLSTEHEYPLRATAEEA